MVGDYFDQHRGKAFGIATSFAGVGAFVFPLIAQFALEAYGLTGVLVLTSSITVHMLISAALFRPIENNYPKVKNQAALKSEKDELKSWTEVLKTVHMKDRSGSEDQKVCRKQTTRKALDLSVLTIHSFIITSFAIMFAQAAAVTYHILIAAHSVSNNVSKPQAVLLISVVGCVEIVSRFSLGFVYDIPIVRRNRRVVYGIFLTILGMSVFLSGIIYRYSLYVVAAVGVALGNSSVISQKGTVFGDCVGNEKLSSAIGIGNFFQGIGVLLGPSLGGKF